MKRIALLITLACALLGCATLNVGAPSGPFLGGGGSSSGLWFDGGAPSSDHCVFYNDGTATRPCPAPPPAPHKLGALVPQRVGDFFVSPAAATPFKLADSSSVTRDTFEMAHGRITAGGGGTDYSVVIGPRWGAETSSGSIHFLPNGTALSSTNFQFAYDGTNVYYNNPGAGSLQFDLLNVAYMTMSAATLQLATPAVQWSASVASPGISQLTQTSDAATNDITIAPQPPFATATLTNRNPGNFVVKTATPVTGTSFNGGFLWERGDGTPGVRIGYYGGPDTTYTGIWFGDGGTPSSSNFAFLGNQSFTYLNAPSGQALVLAIAGSASTGLASTISGGNTWNMTGGSSLTTVNVGTGVSNGVMALRGGNGVTGVSVTAPGSTAGTATTTITGALAVTTRTVTTGFTIDTTTTDNEIFADSTSAPFTITLPTPTNGRVIRLVDKAGQWSTNHITIARHGTETINGTAGSRVLSGSGTAGKWETCTVTSDGTNWMTDCQWLVPLGLILGRKRRRAIANDNAERARKWLARAA